MEVPWGLRKDALGSHRSFIEQSQSQKWAHLPLLVREDPETPPHPQNWYIAIVCSSELDSQILLLKMPHTVVVGHRKRKIKLQLGWKLPPCWLALVVQEGAMQVAGENCQQPVVFSCGPRVQ